MSSQGTYESQLPVLGLQSWFGPHATPLHSSMLKQPGTH